LAVSQKSARIKGGKRAPQQAREWLTDLLHDQLSADRLADLQLLVSEVVTNSVRHGKVGPDGHVEVAVMTRRGAVRVEVRDPGLHGRAAPRSPDFEKGGGFGLMLVERLATRWGIDQTPGLTVWFELPKSGNSAKPSGGRRGAAQRRRNRCAAELDREERAVVRMLAVGEPVEGGIDALDHRRRRGRARRHQLQ
jgi:anti-sigma regulatory factor (Ser/Thr protein kinase)